MNPNRSQDPSSVRPPRVSARILAWLLDDDWDTPAGDFEEYFHQQASSKGQHWARWWYRRQVWALLPGRLVHKAGWSMFMLWNSLKVAIRAMRRQPVMSAVNVGGLATGIAAAVLLTLFVVDEFTFDNMHAKEHRTARVVDVQTTDSGEQQHLVHTMNPLGPALVRDVPGVETVVRMLSSSTLGRQTVTQGDRTYYEGRYLTVDSTFFDVFDYPFLAGDPETALNGPGQVVLTESAARQYFGDADPMGGTLELQWQGAFTVTGVVKDPPPDTHLDFSMLCTLSTMHAFPDWTPFLERWETSNSITYVLLEEGTDIAAVQEGLERLVRDRVEDRRVYLQPMEDIHFGSAHIVFDRNANPSSRTTVLMLLLVGLFIAVIAGINYTNITTAAALGRVREVGLRLTSGAWRSQLVRQFLAESLATTFVATLIAGLLVWATLGPFNSLVGKNLEFNALVPGLLAGILLVTGLLAGAWPAWVLSRVRPADALKGGSRLVGGGNRGRQWLVVTQYALSIGMIAASLIVHAQLRLIQTANLGFDQEQLVVIDINSGQARSSFASIKADMSAVPSVRAVSVSSNVPGDWKSIRQMDAGRTADELVPSAFLGVDSAFLETFGMTLLQGRNLDDRSGADSMSVLLTESTASRLGVSVGDRIHIPGSSLARSFQDSTFEPEVVGIVKDFHFRSLHEPIGAMVIGFHRNPLTAIDYFTVRVDAQNLEETMAELRTIGEQYDPVTPFEYNFLDDRIQDFYVREARLGRLMGIATGLAILLACLGLFALSAYMTVRRTKEIGVRKVLGASVGRITVLLSSEFLKPVLTAFLLCIPATWFIMERWLESFAYRTEPGAGIFLLAGALALVFALTTVSWHTIRAANRNPVDSLKHE
ncbi:MAG: ABC transporter permease [Rhodothermales bacterium]